MVKCCALSHDDPGSILNLGSFKKVGQFFVHSTLPQFTQLYKGVPDELCERIVYRAVIAARLNASQRS